MSRDPGQKWRYRLIKDILEDIDMLSVIFLLAIALRLYLAFTFDMYAQPASKDIELYNNLAANGNYGTYHAPLYPILLRTFYAVFGTNNYNAVFVIQGIIASFLPVLLYLTVRGISNRRSALIAAFITALYPSFIIPCMMIGPDIFNTIIVAVLMYIAVSGLKDMIKSILSAVLVGTGIFINPLFLFIIPGSLMIIKHRIMFLIVLLAILIPWTVNQSFKYNEIIPVYSVRAFGISKRPFTRRHPIRNDDMLAKQPAVSRHLSVKPQLEKNSELEQVVNIGDSSKKRIKEPKFAIYEFDICWAIDNIYKSASTIFARSYTYYSIPDSSKSEIISSYIKSYFYLLVMVMGIIGLIRCFRKEYLPVILLVSLYVLFLIVFIKLEIGSRGMLELLFIVFTSILFSGECRTPAGDNPAQDA